MLFARVENLEIGSSTKFQKKTSKKYTPFWPEILERKKRSFPPGILNVLAAAETIWGGGG